MLIQPIRIFVVWVIVATGTIAGAAAAADRPVLLVVGDSLSAGYGVALESGWVELLRQRLDRRKLPYEVVNASISGETSQGGLSRLPSLLAEYDPALVVIELGGNDGLRGLPLSELAANLRQLVQLARESDARVLLVGMQLPPNYGPEYTGRFAAVYQELAHELDVPLVPFLLEGVGGHRELMQPDGIHAAAGAQPQLLENVWAKLEPLLERRASE